MKDKVIAEFRRLFWAARAEHVKQSPSADGDSPAHRKAMDYALEHGLEWAEALLVASLLENQAKSQDALKLLASAKKKIPATEKGYWWFVNGSALHAVGRVEDAIKAVSKVLQDPNFDAPGKAWNDLGSALDDKGEYDEAIKAYRKALEDPKYDRPGSAWNNLGIALGQKGEYDEAIEAFHKALEDPKYDRPGSVWYNLGLALKYQDNNEEGINAFRQALGDPNFLKEEPWASRARSYIALLESGLLKESLSADDRALLESKPSIREELTPERRILAKIESARGTQYDEYVEKDVSGRDDVFSVLRGWSSAVTLLEGSERLASGGGYFLKWRGKGIVIDPGFDFLRNFHDAEYHGREIDAVLVSHNHSDHNADLKSIDDLRYELYKRLHKKGMEPYLLIWDADTQGSVKFAVAEPEHHFEPISFDLGRCDPCDEIKPRHGLPFSVEYFPVKHGDDVSKAIGFRLHLNGNEGEDLILGYTGDTEFFDELADHLAGCDLLVAHISQPSTKELLNPTARKKNHLGYRGLIELVKKCKPKATLVSEFWAGLTDVRIDLVQAIRERTGNKAILPAGIGMHVHLPGLEVECTQCGNSVPFEKVRVAPPANRFGNLSYLCPSCMLTE